MHKYKSTTHTNVVYMKLQKTVSFPQYSLINSITQLTFFFLAFVNAIKNLRYRNFDEVQMSERKTHQIIE